MRSSNLPTYESAKGRHGTRTVAATIASFEPRHAVRCVGELRFRSQAVRDAASLLDLDPDVLDWSCSPFELNGDGETFTADLSVARTSGLEHVSVLERHGSVAVPDWAFRAAAEVGVVLRVVPHAELIGPRLESARELLRYARWRVSLSQRITVLAALDQEGTLSLVDCMSAVRHSGDPMAVVAALALRRFVEIDLDSGPLGPETRVIRFPR